MPAPEASLGHVAARESAAPPLLLLFVRRARRLAALGRIDLLGVALTLRRDKARQADETKCYLQKRLHAHLIFFVLF